GVERLELRVRVRRDVRDAVAAPDAERLQRRRPPIASIEKLRVRQAQRPVDEGFAVGIQRARPAGEVERSQGGIHVNADWGCRVADYPQSTGKSAINPQSTIC